jgi:hypothetical protein
LRLSVAGGKRLEHAGLKLELKGVLDVASEKAPHEFAAQVLELSGRGVEIPPVPPPRGLA